MSDYSMITAYHTLLQDSTKWYIEIYTPDEPIIQAIAEKAKDNLGVELKKLSINSLYMKWKEWGQYMKQNYIGNAFEAFIDQVACDLAAESLDKEEKLIFEDVCNVTIHFIR